jgi:geranyl-CoA carboxylase alpha subunit
VDGVRRSVQFSKCGDSLYLDDGNGHFRLDNATHAPAAAVAGVGSGELKASMDGAIVSVLVAKGDVVAAGQTLVILEAMKMEHPLKAGVAGTVATLNVAVGDQVKSRQLLVLVAPGEEE